MDKIRKNRKNLLIGILCILICVMTVGYSALSVQLTINNTTRVTSTWDVHISDVVCTTTPAIESMPIVVEKSNTASTATFSIKFNQPDDTATCTVKIQNSGTLNARLHKLVVTNAETLSNGPITISTSGLSDDSSVTSKDGTKIASNNGMSEYKLVFTYDGNTELTEQNKQKSIEISLEYIQDL